MDIRKHIESLDDFEIDPQQRRLLKKALGAGLDKALGQVAQAAKGRSNIQQLNPYTPEGQHQISTAQGFVEAYEMLISILQSEIDKLSEE